MHPAAYPWRGLRASTVAAFCVTGAVVLHVGAGGSPPSFAVFLAFWSAVAVLSFALSYDRWTFGRLFVLLGAGQAFLHPLLEAASASHPEVGYSPVLMAVAHLGSAFGCAAVLARGERALWRLAALADRLVLPLLAVLEPIAPVPSPVRRWVAVVDDGPVRRVGVCTRRAERAPPELLPS